MPELLRLPENLKTKVLSFPEYRMGAHRVALLLRNGEILEDVIVAWGDEVVRVGEGDARDLNAGDIVDVVDRSG